MDVHAVIEYRSDEEALVHVGFDTDEDAVNWAATNLPRGKWSYATLRLAKPAWEAAS